MTSSFTVLLSIGIVVFFVITIFLVCFTRSAIQLPTSLGDYSELLNEWPADSEDLVACLPEDARLSYERAKSEF